MFKIQIKNADSIVTNETEFETFDLCSQWYLSQKANFDLSVPGHTYEIFNIDNEIRERNLDQESLEAIELGTFLIKEIRKINRKKLTSGQWTNEQFQSLLTNSTAAAIERALWNGSLNTADFLISSMTLFYSSQEIQFFKDKITAHENKWRLII